MVLGTVLSVLTVERSAPGYENIRWIQVKTDEGICTAMDPLEVKMGEIVLVAEGVAAARYSMTGCSDAVIVAVLAKDGNNS